MYRIESQPFYVILSLLVSLRTKSLDCSAKAVEGTIRLRRSRNEVARPTSNKMREGHSSSHNGTADARDTRSRSRRQMRSSSTCPNKNKTISTIVLHHTLLLS